MLARKRGGPRQRKQNRTSGRPSCKLQMLKCLKCFLSVPPAVPILSRGNEEATRSSEASKARRALGASKRGQHGRRKLQRQRGRFRRQRGGIWRGRNTSPKRCKRSRPTMLARKSTAVRREGQWKDEARRGVPGKFADVVGKLQRQCGRFRRQRGGEDATRPRSVASVQGQQCWQGRAPRIDAKDSGMLRRKGGSLESLRTSLVSFKDNIEIGGRGEGPFALVVRCSTVRRLPSATPGWHRGGAIQCFPKRQN